MFVCLSVCLYVYLSIDWTPITRSRLIAAVIDWSSDPSDAMSIGFLRGGSCGGRQILQICKLYDCDVTGSRDERPLQYFIITSYRSLHCSAVLTGKTRYLEDTTINWKPQTRPKHRQCCMRKKIIFLSFMFSLVFLHFIRVYGIFL